MIGRLVLIHDLFGDILLPATVYREVVEIGAGLVIDLEPIPTDFEAPPGYALTVASPDRVCLTPSIRFGDDGYDIRTGAALPSTFTRASPEPLLPKVSGVLQALGLSPALESSALAGTGEAMTLRSSTKHGSVGTLVSVGPEGVVAFLEGGAVDVVGSIALGALCCRRGDELVPWEDPVQGCRGRFEVKGALERAVAGHFDWLIDR